MSGSFEKHLKGETLGESDKYNELRFYKALGELFLLTEAPNEKLKKDADFLIGKDRVTLVNKDIIPETICDNNDRIVQLEEKLDDVMAYSFTNPFKRKRQIARDKAKVKSLYREIDKIEGFAKALEDIPTLRKTTLNNLDPYLGLKKGTMLEAFEKMPQIVHRIVVSQVQIQKDYDYLGLPQDDSDPKEKEKAKERLDSRVPKRDSFIKMLPDFEYKNLWWDRISDDEMVQTPKYLTAFVESKTKEAKEQKRAFYGGNPSDQTIDTSRVEKIVNSLTEDEINSLSIPEKIYLQNALSEFDQHYFPLNLYENTKLFKNDSKEIQKAAELGEQIFSTECYMRSDDWNPDDFAEVEQTESFIYKKEREIKSILENLPQTEDVADLQYLLIPHLHHMNDSRVDNSRDIDEKTDDYTDEELDFYVANGFSRSELVNEMSAPSIPNSHLEVDTPDEETKTALIAKLKVQNQNGLNKVKCIKTSKSKIKEYPKKGLKL